MTSIAVEDEFDWDRFVEHYWDRQPVLYRNVATPPFAEEEVFATAAAACQADEAALLPSHIQFVVDKRQELSVSQRLPLASDKNFASYAQRVKELVSDRRYALMVNGFHSFGFDMWARQRDFYQPLWQRIGLPLTTAITTLFHGDYEHSPVGVHRDRFTTFMYVLSGTKRMRMWPEQPWDHDATTVVDYDEFRPGSMAAEVGPGQLLYWPSTYFHVGETVSDVPATSVNVGVPIENHQARYELTELFVDATADTLIDATDQVRRALPAVDEAVMAPGPDQHGMLSSVPDLLPSARRRFEQQVAELAAGARPKAMSLARYTAAGFTMVPPQRTAEPPTDDQTVRHDSRFPILWADSGGRRWYGANGHSVATNVSTDTHEAVIGPLLSGQPRRVGDLLSLLGDEERDHARELLAALDGMRAVTIAD